MDLTKRSYPTALIAIAAMHLGLLLLVLARPKPPQMGTVSYMDLLPVIQPKPRPAPAAAPVRPAPRTAPAVARPPAMRLPAAPAEAAAAVTGVDAIAAEPATESAAPDFAGGPKPLDLDQLRKQAAKNDSDFKSPLDKVREQELRRKSIETTVAAAAKAGARKDCQTAFAGIGIFAIIPLLASSVTDVGCKWK